MENQAVETMKALFNDATTKTQLDALMNVVQNNLPAYAGDWHMKRLKNIVRDCNTYNLAINEKLINEFWAKCAGSYLTFINIVTAYSFQKGKDGRINELVKQLLVRNYTRIATYYWGKDEKGFSAKIETFEEQNAFEETLLKKGFTKLEKEGKPNREWNVCIEDFNFLKFIPLKGVHNEGEIIELCQLLGIEPLNVGWYSQYNAPKVWGNERFTILKTLELRIKDKAFIEAVKPYIIAYLKNDVNTITYIKG